MTTKQKTKDIQPKTIASSKKDQYLVVRLATEENPFLTLDYRLKWLEKEVDILERKIELYDNLSFQIKGWAIVSCSGLLAYSFTSKQVSVSVFSALVASLLLFVDGAYKRYQVVFVKRTRKIMRLLNNRKEIERCLSDSDKCSLKIYDLLNIYEKNSGENDKVILPNILSTLRKSSVNIVYIILILISCVVILLLKYGY